VNPLLKDLFLPATRQEIVRAIAKDPFRDESWTAENGCPELFGTALTLVVCPTDFAIEIAERVFRAIENGLYFRDPASINARRVFSAGGSYWMPDEEVADVVLVLGETGSGKTHAVKAALQSLPQVIDRDAIEELGLRSVRQCIWLKVNMTGIVAIEGLLRGIAGALDAALGQEGRLSKGLFAGTRTVEAMTDALLRRLKTQLLGVLVLDEIQKQNFGFDRKDAARLRNLLIGFINTGIPVVLSGNSMAVRFEELGGDASVGHRGSTESSQLARRIFKKSPVIYEPPTNADDQQFRLLVDAIVRCRLPNIQVTASKDLYEEIYRATAGFPDFVSQLWAEANAIARGEDLKVIDGAIVKRAADMCPLLRKMRNFVAAFVNRDCAQLEAFSDVDVERYRIQWEKSSKAHPREKDWVETVDPGKTLDSKRRVFDRQIKKMESPCEVDEELLKQVNDSYLRKLKSILSE